jgi:hypothetical protein
LAPIQTTRGAQSQKRQLTKDETDYSHQQYQKILNALFPHDLGNFRDHTKKYAWVLRVGPSFDAESQINITQRWDGSIDVVKHTARRNVGYHVYELLAQKGIEDLEDKDIPEIVRLIPIDKQVVKNPGADLKWLLKQFFTLRLSMGSDVSIMADGTCYDIWYENAQYEVHFSLQDSNTGQKRYKNPVVQWVNDVLRVVK